MAQIVHEFGHNPTVGTTWEDVWTRGGIYPWPSTAGPLRVFAASTKDTSTGSGGVGARTIRIEGLDATFTPITEDVSLTNTTVVTSSTFVRVNVAYVVESGTYGTLVAGSNQGNIRINDATSGACSEIVVSSTIGMGQTQDGRYTVPAGLYGYINSWSVTASASANKTADFALFAREDADTVVAPFGSRRLQIEIDSVSGEEDSNPDVPYGPFPAKTDLWWAAKGEAETTVSVDFEIILTPTTFQLSI